MQVNQPPLKHPPVFKLLTGFFGQSGEKFGLCAKKFGPSIMKFWGILALKTLTKLFAGFLASTFLFSAFFSNAAEFSSRWHSAQDYNQFYRVLDNRNGDICTQFSEIRRYLKVKIRLKEHNLKI